MVYEDNLELDWDGYNYLMLIQAGLRYIVDLSLYYFIPSQRWPILKQDMHNL